MHTLLNQLYEKIDDEVKSIVQVINYGETFQSSVFDSPVIVEKALTRENPLWGRKGVYVFIVKETITLKETQVRDWNEKVHGAGFREYKKIEINDGECLYVGSSISNSLYSRIQQHFAEKGSFQALKLGHPVRNIFQGIVVCIAFPIKREYVEEHYRILLPAIEKRLHKLLVPLCGSSRT